MNFEGEYYQKISWTDDYVKNLVPYIFVREEDGLLIKIPNQVFKLNSSGLMVLKRMLEGESVYQILKPYRNKESAARDIHFFFCDLYALLKGCYRETEERKAVEKIPFVLPFNTLPVLSELALTYRCNLACRFCYASCGCIRNDLFSEMTTGQVKTVIGIIREEAAVPSISFTGGEPCLRKDLTEIVRFAKSLDMWTNLITNGTLIDSALAKDLKDAGLDSGQVSLEAADPGLHDRITGGPGSYWKTLKGIENLRKAGIRVHTNTTISGLNKNYLIELVGLVKELGLDRFSMNMLMPAGSAAENLKELLVTYSEIGSLVLQVKQAASDYDLEFMWYSPTPVCIFNPVSHGLGNKGCAACDGLLSVAPNGDILPCSSYPEAMANMLEIRGRFRETWQSDDFVYFQKKRFSHSRCLECVDLAVCNGGCLLYWRRVGYRELLEQKKAEVRVEYSS